VVFTVAEAEKALMRRLHRRPGGRGGAADAAGAAA
jgi:hypothetical protein